KFKILAIPNVLAHGKSYEHSFTKKCDDHKYCAKSRFESIFHAPSQKFKILAIPNVLANGKSYEHGFMEKYNSHKLCSKLHAKSSFDWFFMHRIENSKYRPFLTY
ncbi:hypothetical protein B296_00017221, partial [Ensete ventricosum]